MVKLYIWIWTIKETSEIVNFIYDVEQRPWSKKFSYNTPPFLRLVLILWLFWNRKQLVRWLEMIIAPSLRLSWTRPMAPVIIEILPRNCNPLTVAIMTTWRCCTNTARTSPSLQRRVCPMWWAPHSRRMQQPATYSPSPRIGAVTWKCSRKRRIVSLAITTRSLSSSPPPPAAVGVELITTTSQAVRRENTEMAFCQSSRTAQRTKRSRQIKTKISMRAGTSQMAVITIRFNSSHRSSSGSFLVMTVTLVRVYSVLRVATMMIQWIIPSLFREPMKLFTTLTTRKVKKPRWPCATTTLSKGLRRSRSRDKPTKVVRMRRFIAGTMDKLNRKTEWLTRTCCSPIQVKVASLTAPIWLKKPRETSVLMWPVIPTSFQTMLKVSIIK